MVIVILPLFIWGVLNIYLKLNEKNFRFVFQCLSLRAKYIFIYVLIALIHFSLRFSCSLHFGKIK